jgi:hypothetical protein
MLQADARGIGRPNFRSNDMRTTYEIRTMRDARVFSFDSLSRAQQEQLSAEKRIGVKLKIVKVTQVEEIVA